jgi:copper chaperone CopZ
MRAQQYRRVLILLAFAVGGCSDLTESVSVPTSTVQFALPDMMCEDGCAQAVEDILERQPGAMEVQVDFEGKTAIVVIEDGVFDSQQALAALIDKGFDNSKLTSSAGTGATDVTSSEPSADQ